MRRENLTLDEVASRVGCSGSLIGRYRSGKTTPSVNMAVALGKAFPKYAAQLSAAVEEQADSDRGKKVQEAARIAATSTPAPVVGQISGPLFYVSDDIREIEIMITKTSDPKLAAESVKALLAGMIARRQKT